MKKSILCQAAATGKLFTNELYTTTTGTNTENAGNNIVTTMKSEPAITKYPYRPQHIYAPGADSAVYIEDIIVTREHAFMVVTEKS